MPRSFTFSLFSSITNKCMLLEFYFKTFVLSFHGSYHLDDPSLFEAYIRPPL